VKPTPTPSFPVEKQKEKLRVLSQSLSLKKEILAVTKGVFADATNFDPMRGGLEVLNFLWRPNNYRLKIPFVKGSDPKQETKQLGGLFPVEIREGTTTLKVDEKITLMIHPENVIGIWSLKNKKKEKLWYNVKIDSIDALDDWIDSKVKEIQEALQSEFKKLKLSLDYSKAVWIRHEDGIKGEEFLDGLSSSLIIHDTYFKKVYANEVEMKAPAYVKTFIANRAIEKIAPEIAKELVELKNLVLEVPKTANSPHPPYCIPNSGTSRLDFKQELLIRKILKPNASAEEWLSYLQENQEAILNLNWSGVKI